jgi:hypothetical protein
VTPGVIALVSGFPSSVLHRVGESSTLYANSHPYEEGTNGHCHQGGSGYGS